MKKILLLMLAMVLPAITFAETHKVHYEQTGEGTFTVQYGSNYHYYTLPQDSCVDEGTSIQIHAVAPSDKRIESLMVNDVDMKSSLKSGYYTFTVGTEDVNIVCNFETEAPSTYAVTGTVDGEGTLNLQYSDGVWLSFESGQEFAEGTWVRIHPTGHTSYGLTALTKNGEDIMSKLTEGGYYSCQVGKGGIVFAATFAQDPTKEFCNVKVTLHKGPGVVEKVMTVNSQEKIELNYPTENEVTEFQVAKDEYLEFTMEPSEGCHVSSLLFNGTEYGGRVAYSKEKCTWRTPKITSTDATTEIEIFFDDDEEPQYYAVKFSVKEEGTGTISVYNGSTELTSGDKVLEGTTLTAVMTPAEGYVVKTAYVNDVDVESYIHGNTFSFNLDDEKDYNVVAEFQEEEAGIDEINSNLSPLSSHLYDLTGRRISGNVRGVFIQNGKKVIK